MNKRYGELSSERLAKEVHERMMKHIGETVEHPYDMSDLLFHYENTHSAWYEDNSLENAKEDINDDIYFFCAIAQRHYCKWGQFTSFADDIVAFHSEMMCFTYYHLLPYLLFSWFLPGTAIEDDDETAFVITEEFAELFCKILAEYDEVFDDYDSWAP